MSGCPDVADLELLLDESLPGGRQAAVEEHLAGCPACQAVLDRLTAPTDPRLAGLAAPSASPSTASLGAGDAPASPAEPPAANPPGYVVLREVGRGGMGVVYLARQRGLNRVVALKMILAGAHASAEQSARFLGEAQIIASLRHPNIVQVIEVGYHNRQAYLAMEYVEGGNLASLLAKEPQLARASAGLVERLARAVHHAHQAGIVHRDLKPANVLLVRRASGPPAPSPQQAGRSLHDDFKITDFGLAKYIEGNASLTPSHAMVGTPQYMAPEQAAGGKAVGPAADVYALGAILYECLTGRPPFLGSTPLETAMQVLGDDPVSVGRLQPGVPRDLAVVCMKCLHKDPARRYGSAASLADDLRRFLDGRPVTARPVSPVERSLKWARRSPAVAGLLASLILVVAVAFGLVSWQWGVARERAEAADLAREGEATERGKAEANERREKATRLEMERLTAGLTIDQGAAQCDRGDVGPGLLTLAAGLGLAVRAGDSDLERLARLQLAAWQQQLVRPVARLRHARNVTAVAYSRDGQLVATAGRDGVVKLWDAVTGAARGQLAPTHPYPVFSVAFSPDGRRLVTGAGPEGGGEGEARLWDVATGQPASPALRRPSTVSAVAFAADGERFLAVCAAEAQVWQTADLRPLPTPLRHQGGVAAAAFRPDGQVVLTGGAGGGRLWDAASGELLKELKHPHKPVYCVAFSPDGALAATGDGEGVARQWDAATGEPHGRPMLHRGPVRALAMAVGLLATGSWLLEPDFDRKTMHGAGGEARLWDADGRPLGRPLPHALPVWAVALSHDGRLLATGCEDGHARVFLAGTGALVGRPLRSAGLVRQVAFRLDGLGLVGAGDGGDHKVGASAGLWLLPGGLGGRELVPQRHRHSTRWLVPSPDGSRLLAYRVEGDRHCAVVLDVATGRTVARLEHPGPVGMGRFSPDGRTVATGCKDGFLRLWSAETGKELAGCPAGGSVGALDFHPGGRLVAAAAPGGTARLFRVADARPEGEPLKGSADVWGLRFDDGGSSLWAVTSDHAVRKWDLASGTVMRSWDAPGELTAPSFRPDGLALLSATAAGRRAQLRDLATGRPEGAPLSHPASVISGLAFSDDGRLAASAGGYEVLLWDMPTRRRVGPALTQSSAVLGVAFRPGARSFAVGGDCSLQLHDAPSPVGGTPEQTRLWAEALTGQRLDPEGVVYDLTPRELEARRRLK
jgi:eukaryotic-like serine/threonine-protein kinase